jgi:hypothetical protein
MEFLFRLLPRSDFSLAGLMQLRIIDGDCCLRG